MQLVDYKRNNMFEVFFSSYILDDNHFDELRLYTHKVVFKDNDDIVFHIYNTADGSISCLINDLTRCCEAKARIVKYGPDHSVSSIKTFVTSRISSKESDFDWSNSGPASIILTFKEPTLLN